MSKLFIIPTPIGNLEDITFRAIRILQEADVLLAEDTRTSSILLRHHGIEKKMFSHHAFNEHHTLPRLIEILEKGQTIALISDAGTPGISDPGFLIVRECIKNKIEVECLPGATALIPALIQSGFPGEKFCFEGFLPVKKGRQTALKKLAKEERTMIFYESPHRILKTLNDFVLTFGEERQISVSRELSKKFEETIRGSLAEVAAHFKNHPPKGEFVIVVKGV
ncbi:MAG: 16S rRNA (cytidine(1402)-2'-O)-methyltransferase [Bacteroidia bacterium]|nr:16S rRNA (cytidine(1402)-2'-O)-methyltransferase [Bacteroidia bacterium]MCZ2277071.1 16S rRNA (cytidine(1402)-2'-O)-methyltransferase [Bacteroidia bacterium]